MSGSSNKAARPRAEGFGRFPPRNLSRRLQMAPFDGKSEVPMAA
jgi:hypothetical protein